MKENSKIKLQNAKFNKGFTLIELILYVALVSMMFATLVPFAWRIIEGGVKVGVEQEVYSQARYLSQRIKKEIRDASSVTTCNATTLTLVNPVAALSPTTFTAGSSQITITQGTSVPSPIRLHSIDTSIDTSISAPTFCTNYTGTNTDNVQIKFIISSNYPSSTRNEYAESLSVQVTGETRN